MKNIKKLLSIILYTLLLVSVTANGAVNTSYRVETNSKGTLNQIVSVTGEDISYKGKTVTLRVFQKDKTKDDIEGRQSDLDVFYLIDQTKADNNGKFEFTFIMNKSQGDYLCDIKVDNNSLIPLTLTLSDVKKANDVITLLNDPQKADLVTTNDLQPILSEGDKFGINTLVYNRLTDKDAITLAVIKGAKKKLSQNENIAFEDFITLFNNAVVLEAFRTSNDETLLSDTIDIYDEFLGLTSLQNAKNIYATYLALNDKKTPLLKMGKKDYTIDTLIDDFKENVFIEAVKEVVYYTDLEDVIENNSDYLALGDAYTRYSNSDDLETHILKELTKIKDKINSVSEFKQEFKNSITSYDNSLVPPAIILPPPSVPGTGGGTGGGGGGSSNVSVSTELSKPEVDAPTVIMPSFTDMSGHWAKSSVDTLVNKGVLQGKEVDKFCPDDFVTREEFVTMIVKAFDLKSEGTSKFNDVSQDRWSYPYVLVANALGIVMGNNNMFMPINNITRQDMAVIIYRTLQYQGFEPVRGNVDVLFSDYDKISDYAKNSVTMLYYSNLISGDGENFNPHSNATRAEAAQMIYNVLKGE
ncbi:MAG: S-layer homology domain-containing protein [Ruminococcaceae bacterium]|nr:S-layer homology domain-containing protein [Oscillospiraceae bacterium]